MLYDLHNCTIIMSSYYIKVGSIHISKSGLQIYSGENFTQLKSCVMCIQTYQSSCKSCNTIGQFS